MLSIRFPPAFPCTSPAVPRQPTGSGAAAFGMPLPLAPLTATGDARDPTTMRTACVVAAATVTAMWWRGARSSWRSSWFALFLSLPFLCADGFAVVRWGCMSGPWGKGGQGVYRPNAPLAAVCHHHLRPPLVLFYHPRLTHLLVNFAARRCAAS